ncbi:beta-ketoacyl-ACP reductase [[Eubacterium] cellulosolvens]
MRLKDKVALITGGGSGIGEATVLRFAEEGAKIAVCDINEDGAKAVAEKCKTAGVEAEAYKMDVSNKQNVDEVMNTVVERFGRLDILVNNAGITQDSFAAKMTEEQWDRVINVNLKGTFLCCQAAIPIMKEQNYGRIVNTSSIGILGNLGQTNYAASKMGIIGLTRTLALELARNNITVNCISPGATKTPMTAKIPEDIAKQFTAKIPFKRFAEASEIANAHVFFASDEAGYITGQMIFVAGGLDLGL